MPAETYRHLGSSEIMQRCQHCRRDNCFSATPTNCTHCGPKWQPQWRASRLAPIATDLRPSITALLAGTSCAGSLLMTKLPAGKHVILLWGSRNFRCMHRDILGLSKLFISFLLHYQLKCLVAVLICFPKSFCSNTKSCKILKIFM